MGCLGSTFGNSSPKTKTLVNRMNRGVYEVSRRPQTRAPRDDRGPAGVSMRAIGRRMGVDRKAVRAVLVEAGLIVDDTGSRLSDSPDPI